MATRTRSKSSRDRSEHIGKSCAARGCGQSKSGSPMFARPSLRERPAGSRSDCKSARKRRTTRLSSTQSLFGARSETGRGLDGCRRAKDYAGKPRPVVIVQDDRFETTNSITTCLPDFPRRIPGTPFCSAYRSDPMTEMDLRALCRIMVDKVITIPRTKTR